MSTDVTSKFALTDHTCIIQTKNKFSEHMICFKITTKMLSYEIILHKRKLTKHD